MSQLASTNGSSRGNVLITGASTGIGRECALHLASLGFGIFAGVRRDRDAAALQKLAQQNGAGRIQPLLLDVTDSVSITAAAGSLKQSTGSAGLAGLVNNAGISVSGPAEFVSLDDWRRQFEVNFFGPIAVTQAMLPLLRAHVAHAGPGSARLIMMSSVAGRVAQPIAGPYTSSKFALEALSDALRMELRAQGIHVCLIEPGAIDTPIWTKGKGLPADHPARQLYGQQIDAVTAVMTKAAAGAIPAMAVAKAVAAAMTRRTPRTRYPVGNDAKAGILSRKLMPDRLFDFAMRRFYKMD